MVCKYVGTESGHREWAPCEEGTRKRAVTCLATLSASMSDALLAATAAAAVEKLSAAGDAAVAAAPENQSNTALYVQLLGAMVRSTVTPTPLHSIYVDWCISFAATVVVC